MLIGFYNYTVILTYIGLGSGVAGIMMAFGHNFKAALLCLMISGLCDMFDGTIARSCKTRSHEAKIFGGQIDALCDLVCFGLLPAIICFSLCPRHIVTFLCALFYVLAAVIRLAYFEVQEITRSESEGRRTHYTGLPVPTSVVVAPAVLLLSSVNGFSWPFLYPVILAVLGLLFISRFKVKKPYRIGLLLLSLLILAMFVLVCLFGGNVVSFAG